MKDILRKKYLFQGLDDDVLDEISKFSKIVNYEPGESIIEKNEESYDIFIVRKGRVDIYLSSKNSVKEEQLGILSLYPFEIFGEMSCIIRKQRSATVVSYDSSELLKIDGPKLSEYMDTNREVGFMIYKRIGAVLSEKLKNTNLLWSQLNLVNQIMKNTQKEKAEFYRVAAHELKSPVASVTAMLKSVNYLYKDKMDPKAYELTLQAEKRSDTIIDSIKDLLELSEKTAGIKEINIESNDMLKIVDQAIKSEGFRLKAANIKVIRKYDKTQNPTVNVDSKEFTKVFTNLISNAIRYSPKTSEITIKNWVSHNIYNLSVSDQGIGIDKKDIPKLGKDFYRTKHAKKHSQSGSGLGMAIIMSIIKQYGGRLEIKSELGKGSKFIVKLPL